MEKFDNYYLFLRDRWKCFYKNETLPLNQLELEQIKSLNDKISLQDVNDIYAPLTQLIYIYKQNHEFLQFNRALFTQKNLKKVPFVIGIAGSVAVGKSTVARLLQIMLSSMFTNLSVKLITTDGFLYSKNELIKKEILHRKGFPESYNMKTLISFLSALKSGKRDLRVPIYSHAIYDIVPNSFEPINQPDILIIEGINVLQLPANEQIYVSDFFDFSIYVDAKTEVIEDWYMKRFKILLELARNDESNYYHKFIHLSDEEALKIAKDTWKNINLKNLNEFILPTKSRANLILHKDSEHLIKEIWLRKY